ncbi:MAG: HAD family hydrolase [Ruminococcus sp.]|nr:HAD family hydrolase [Ruminococcus sp.]
MFEDITKVVLLSDMDGTLLNSRKEISDTDRRAIEKFMSLGGKFTVATGRTIQSFGSYRSMMELKMPLIMYNGAAIYDYNTDKVLYSQPLPPEAKQITREILDALPQAGGEILKADGTYVIRNNDYEELHTKLCRIEPFYSELDEVSEGDWLKVLFAMAPEDIPQIEIFVKQKNYNIVSFVKSSEIFCEMLPLGITKGSALAEYRRLEGLENHTFVAIGDFDNDIEMLREADLGAAPANAEESVKRAADLVLKNSCETGAVAELIEYIIEKCGDKYE